MEQMLKKFPVIFEQRVAWGDMDAFGHVNNVMFYRYLESARIAYLEHLQVFDDSSMTVLASSSCQYLKPVFFPDTLHIGARVSKLGNTSCVMTYAVYSTQQQAVVATGEAVVVRLNKAGTQKLAISDELRARIITEEATCGNTVT